jgi:hypothetical protein
VEVDEEILEENLMGCNSHLTIEIKQRWESDKSWSVWALDLPESRDYNLYTSMAGVRAADDEVPLIEPRGIPADAATGTAYWIKRAGVDGHSHSWLSPEEFHAAVVHAKAGDTKEWSSLDEILITLEKTYGKNNVRLVFFFDN